MMLSKITKSVLAALAAAIFVLPANADDSSPDDSLIPASEEQVSEVQTSENDDISDDIDGLFGEDNDVEGAVTSDSDSASGGTSFSFLSIPLEMRGELETEVGAAIKWDDHYPNGSAYFNLENYLHFLTRPDKYMALKGSLKTSLPDAEEAENDNQNRYFYLYELYFDYIMANRVYITAGKKKTNWGCVRLFSDDENDDEERDDDALYTNPLCDSRYNISGIVRVPFGSSSVTLLTMYRGTGSLKNPPTYRDLSFAGNLELVFFDTYFNLFGRSFPSSNGTLAKYYRSPLVGMELKKTLFGFDIYAQEQASFVSMKRLRQFWKKELYCSDSIEKLTFTGGFYRFWNSSYPYVGINAEFQSIYYPTDNYEMSYEADENGDYDWVQGDISHEAYSFQNRLMVDIGVAKFGYENKFKAGLQWYHDFTNVRGYIKPIFIVSRVFPHCDWKSGFKYEYDKEYDYGKFTLGTYFQFNLSY
ncbi:MAG: hypothetical protein K6B43_06860 [Treponema sp.]|nr:hypothetical protein [Treponema sp.]